MEEMEDVFFIVREDGAVMFTSFSSSEEAYAYLNSDAFTDEERVYYDVVGGLL